MKKIIVPWWLCALLAVLFYCGCKYLPPLFLSEPWVGYIPRLAPLGAMGLLLYGAAMLYEGDQPTTDDGGCETPENDPLASPEYVNDQWEPPQKDESLRG